MIGGTFSIIVSLYVYWMAYDKGREMLNLDDPYISSVTAKLDPDDLEEEDAHFGKFNRMSIPILELLDGSME